MALRFSSGLLTGLQQYGQGAPVPSDPRMQTRLQAAGVTNPLLQAFGQGLGGMLGTEMRSPAAIAQEQKALEEQKAKQAEATTQGLLMSQLEASTALTPAQKETYKAMINSGDINPQQVIDAITMAEKTQQADAQTTQVKAALVKEGFTEEELNRLTPAQLQSYVKSSIDQKRTNAQTAEGAQAYLSTLDVAPQYVEQAQETIASDSWANLTEAQRTKYFAGLEQQTKVDKAITNLTKMMESLPEGERKQEAQTVIDDVRAGFIAPDKARELIRVKRDPAMTETNTVVSIGDGKVAKVINKKVGNDTVKVYLDPTSGKEFPVTAEMLQSKKEITKKGWPSSASTKFVEDLMLSSSTIKDYVAGDTGWYTSDAEEEEMFNKRIELAAKVEELKQEGLTPPEVKEEILKFIGKDNGEATSILSEADRILEGM
jgi:hypothetical protein